jgi:hypothetical protein
MDTNKALARWVNSQIGKGKDKPYATNEEFGKAFDLSEGTVRRLRKGYSTAKNTINKLATGIHMPLSDFLKMIEELDRDPNVHVEIEHRMMSDINELSPEEKQVVWNVVQGFLDRKKK